MGGQVVAAVHAAQRSGEGQFLDVAMYDGVLLLCESIVYKFSAAGEVQGPKGFGHPALSPFDVYETRDGAAAIAAPKDEQWQALCEAMGRPDLALDERTVNVLVRASHRELVNEAPPNGADPRD